MIYAINFQRTRMKEKIDPGNWELHVSGTQYPIKLIDDSTVSDGTVTEAGRQYFIRSGTIDAGVMASNTYHYGLVYPDMGVIVLFPAELGMPLDLNYCWCASAPSGYSNIAGVHVAKPFSLRLL